MTNHWKFKISSMLLALALVVFVSGGVLAQEMREFHTSGVIIPFAGTGVPFDEEAVYRWTVSGPAISVSKPELNVEAHANVDAHAKGILSDLPYRVDLIVETDEMLPVAWPIELDVDFGAWLEALEVQGTVNPASLTLVANTVHGPVQVPVQFSPADADQADQAGQPNQADQLDQAGQQGQLIWIINDETGTRFTLYFEVVSSGDNDSTQATTTSVLTELPDGAIHGNLDNLVIRNDHYRAVLLDQSGFLGPIYVRQGDEQIPVTSWDAIWIALNNNWWGPWEAFGRYDFTDQGPNRIVTRAQVNGRIDGRRIQVVKSYSFYAGTPVIRFETTFIVEDGDLDKDMFESLHLTLSDSSGLWARIPQGDGVSQMSMEGRQGFELEREWVTFGNAVGGVTVAVAEHFVDGLFAISDEHLLVSIK